MSVLMPLHIHNSRDLLHSKGTQLRPINLTSVINAGSPSNATMTPNAIETRTKAGRLVHPRFLSLRRSKVLFISSLLLAGADEVIREKMRLPDIRYVAPHIAHNRSSSSTFRLGSNAMASQTRMTSIWKTDLFPVIDMDLIELLNSFTCRGRRGKCLLESGSCVPRAKDVFYKRSHMGRCMPPERFLSATSRCSLVP
jgi:hypothetical protein